MRKIGRHFVTRTAIASALAFTTTHVAMAQNKLADNVIKKGFLNPPDSVKPYVYWYWINGHISADGAVKDLEAMKKVGIGGAFIGNIGLTPEEGTSYGKVKMFSDTWWDAITKSFQYASKNNITLGLFNGPGWSQSGGPWVKPNQSMRYVAVKRTAVNGPVKLSYKVAPANSDTGYIATLAMRDVAGKRLTPLLSATSSKAGNLDKLTDGLMETQATLPPDETGGKSCTVNLSFENPVAAQGIVFYPAEHPFATDVLLQNNENGTFKTLRSFRIDRRNPNLNVGFMPYAPVAIALPGISSKSLRLVFENMDGDVAFKEISLSETPIVDQYYEKQLAKMYQSPVPSWSEYQWPLQPGSVPATDTPQIIDLKPFISADGKLEWEVPSGNWTILNYTLVPTGVTNSPAPPEGRGLEVDKMNSAHLQPHFNAYAGKIIERLPAKDRTAFKYLVADSYEVGSQNWTDSLQDSFIKVYGYDPIPWLPTLNGVVVKNADASDRFLWDLRRLVADKIAVEYVGGLRKIGNQHGLRLWLENYGHWGFASEFLKYGGQSDEVSGEFWNEGELGNIENKSASSAAHIYGKTRVWAESFTAGGGEFTRYPALLKKRGDWSFTEGVNQSLLHLYIHQPYDSLNPGVNAWFSTEFNRKNSWFNMGKGYIDYLRRCNYLLQQGKPVNDVAYFIGEDAPKMTGTRQPALPAGYSYDYINAEVIMNRLTVRDGRLVLPDGISYRMLVLPPVINMRPELLQKITSLVNAGAVVLGSAPQSSPSLQNYPAADSNVVAMASALWGGKKIQPGISQYGNGLVMDGIGMQTALDYLKLLPDFKNSQGQAVLYTHRVSNGDDIYFITNQSDKKIEFSASFRVTDALPQWWDAITGSTRDLPDFKQDGGTITLPIKLDVNESGFVVFSRKNKPGKTSAKENFPTAKQVLVLEKEWNVTFNHKLTGEPVKNLVFKSLISWDKHPDSSVKGYAGTATYASSFLFRGKTGDGKLVLDIGALAGMAKVWLNGKEVGSAWTAPWQLDISTAIRTGENKIEIEVANTWVNHLISDSKLETNDKMKWTGVNHFTSKDRLEKSGLIGPVSVQQINY